MIISSNAAAINLAMAMVCAAVKLAEGGLDVELAAAATRKAEDDPVLELAVQRKAVQRKAVQRRPVPGLGTSVGRRRKMSEGCVWTWAGDRHKNAPLALTVPRGRAPAGLNGKAG